MGTLLVAGAVPVVAVGAVIARHAAIEVQTASEWRSVGLGALAAATVGVAGIVAGMRMRAPRRSRKGMLLGLAGLVGPVLLLATATPALPYAAEWRAYFAKRWISAASLPALATTPPTLSHPEPGRPGPRVASFEGTFEGDGVVLSLVARPLGYSGTLTFGGQSMPCSALLPKEDRLGGRFQANGTLHLFEVEQAPEGVLLRSAGRSYQLVRRRVPTVGSVTPTPEARPDQSWGEPPPPPALPPNRVTVSYRLNLINDKNVFFPSVAHLYGKEIGGHRLGFCTVTVSNPEDRFRRLRVEVNVEGLATPASSVLDVGGRASVTADFVPSFTSAVSEVREERPGVVAIRVEDDQGTTVYEQREPIVVASRNDLYLGDDLLAFMTVFVTPRAVAVEGLITDMRRALGRGLGGSGPRTGSDVLEEVGALYSVLASRGLGYRNATNTYLPAHGLAGQRVYFPDESMSGQSANCLDTVVLFASVLEHLDMNVHLLLVPGHVFLGVAADDDPNSFALVETTMVGSASFEAATAQAGQQFEQARSAGTLRGIELRKARALGVTPFPWPVR